MNTNNKFSYLVEKQLKENYELFLNSDENKNIYFNNAQVRLMALLEILGFHVYGVHFPYINKTQKKKDFLFNFILEPSLDFYVKGRPHEKYKGEYRAIEKVLKKYKHNTIHPYLNWATEEGEKIRNEVDEEFKNLSLSFEYKIWKKDHNKKK
jgi:hypothetical protein